MTLITVNGQECNLHESVGWLNYGRVVRLSGLPYRDDYVVKYADNNYVTGYMHDIGGGVFPLPGMYFSVAPSDKKPWWRYLWPA